MFDEETPHDVIAELQPDVLVKGADWAENAIVGRDIVEARGGRVVRVPIETGYSTTAIIQKIRNLTDQGGERWPPTNRRPVVRNAGSAFPTTVRICPEDGTVLERPTMAATSTGVVLDSKYRLDSMIAEGGMGSVYKATHVMLGKTVAIKLIKPAIVTSPEDRAPVPARSPGSHGSQPSEHRLGV